MYKVGGCILSKSFNPAVVIIIGFALMILVGATLLKLPISALEGIEIKTIDAVFTSASAVCVTGLISIDIANNFSVFGRTVVALLIQIGGLGVTTVGVWIMIMMGKKVGLTSKLLIKEAYNLNSVSIAAFNNSGADILGDFKNLLPYQDDILLNAVTCGLIIFGGLGFYTISEIQQKKRFKEFCLNTKVVIVMTIALLLGGTVLLKFTERISWLGCFFQSTAARTAGFSTYAIGGFSNAGIVVLILLMFVGASPGSTGGGIKTTTAYLLLKSIFNKSGNGECVAFKRRISSENILKAFILTNMSLALIVMFTFLICYVEGEFAFMDVLFETVSAFGTVGLTRGITPNLKTLSKMIICVTMFIGRVGPLTIACLWSFRKVTDTNYQKENIMIG
ncbi:MAG: H(+)-transporting ATPase [Clostridiales bacterium]|nr:H(+)-transporting ATPase [Clostridiales bacterium]